MCHQCLFLCLPDFTGKELIPELTVLHCSVVLIKLNEQRNADLQSVPVNHPFKRCYVKAFELHTNLSDLLLLYKIQIKRIHREAIQVVVEVFVVACQLEWIARGGLQKGRCSRLESLT